MIGIHTMEEHLLKRGEKLLRISGNALVIYDVDEQFCDDYMNISQIHFILEGLPSVSG